MSEDKIVIVSYSRTPQGAFQGTLSSLSAPELGSFAIKAALGKVAIDVAKIDEVVMGCVLSAGQGQAPARQASIGGGIPKSVGATTINKMCGSGMKAVMFGHDLIKAGSANIVVTGGMESMSNAPYLLDRARAGYRMGHGKVIDHMFFDGLEDAYDKSKLMGVFADDTARKLDISREEQDNFALASLQKAQTAQENGAFDGEITPITVKSKKGDIEITEDEAPKLAKPEKIPNLRPAFSTDGTVTAANASSISDGAATLVLMRESDAKAKDLKIIAKITSHATHAQEPHEFTIAPIGAMQKALDKAGLSVFDIDLFEINEAFAVVSIAAIRGLSLDVDKVNVNGGACALGHPIGASGARIIVTLLNALAKRGLKRGLASLCIGGGEAVAMTFEMAE